MRTQKHLKSHLLSFAFIACLVTVPVFGDASAQRNSLTSQQRADFKKQKRDIQKRQQTSQKQIRDINPRLAAQTRDYNAKGAALMKETAAVRREEQQLARFVSYERGKAIERGEPYRPSARVVQMEGYVAAANANLRSVSAAFNSSFEAMNTSLQQKTQAQAAIRQAANDMAVRKTNKANARSENLTKAAERKAQRAAARNGAPNAAGGAVVPKPEFASLRGLSGRSASSSIFNDFVAAGAGPNPSGNSGSASVTSSQRLPNVPFSTPSDRSLSQNGPLPRVPSAVFTDLIADRSRRESTGPARQAPSRAAFSRENSTNLRPMPGYTVARPSTSQMFPGYTDGPPSNRTSYTLPGSPAAQTISRVNSEGIQF